MNDGVPDRLTFKRKEVIKITKLDGKVLDYWEKEFDALRPIVNKMGEKFYTRKDIDLIMRIKQLLYEDRKSKAEVKELLQIGGAEEQQATEEPAEPPVKKPKINHDKLKRIKKSLEEILTILEKDDKN